MCACQSSCITLCLILQTSKTQMPVDPFPFPFYIISNSLSDVFHSPSRPFSYFPEADACHMPSVSFMCVSPFLRGGCDYVSPPLSSHCVCVCAPHWYSNLFHFPLEKLASFDGPGKTTKMEALTFSHICVFFLLLLAFAYMSLTLPTRFLSLNFFPTRSFHTAFFIPF